MMLSSARFKNNVQFSECYVLKRKTWKDKCIIMVMLLRNPHTIFGRPTLKVVEWFENGSFHEFCHLKALITLEQLITSVVEKKNNLHEQNFKVYWKIRIEDQGSTIRDRGSVKKKLENKIDK